MNYKLKVYTSGLHLGCILHANKPLLGAYLNASNACSTGLLCSEQRRVLEGQTAAAACSGPAQFTDPALCLLTTVLQLLAGLTRLKIHALPPAAIDARCRK